MSHFLYVMHLIHCHGLIIEITGDIRSVCMEPGLQGVQEIFCWAQTECICIPCVSLCLSLNTSSCSVEYCFPGYPNQKKSSGVEWFIDEGINLLQIPSHEETNSFKVYPRVS